MGTGLNSLRSPPACLCSRAAQHEETALIDPSAHPQIHQSYSLRTFCCAKSMSTDCTPSIFSATRRTAPTQPCSARGSKDAVFRSDSQHRSSSCGWQVAVLGSTTLSALQPLPWHAMPQKTVQTPQARQHGRWLQPTRLERTSQAMATLSATSDIAALLCSLQQGVEGSGVLTKAAPAGGGGGRLAPPTGTLCCRRCFTCFRHFQASAWAPWQGGQSNQGTWWAPVVCAEGCGQAARVPR